MTRATSSSASSPDMNDAFWSIALESDDTYTPMSSIINHHEDDQLDENDDNDECCPRRRRTYRIDEDLVLHLTPLSAASTAGDISAPVGAQVWYASSILAGLVTSNDFFKSLFDGNSSSYKNNHVGVGIRCHGIGGTCARLTATNDDTTTSTTKHHSTNGCKSRWNLTTVTSKCPIQY
jgi:hypothetical protein